jgi:hypothetical protein
MAPMLARTPGRPFSLEPLIAEAKRRARRRRWLLLIALVLVAAAVAAFELRSASGSGLPSSGGKPVIHIVMEEPPSTLYFDLKTGREADKTLREQLWFDRRQNGQHRAVSSQGGEPVTDEVWRAHYAPTTQAAAVDRFYASLTGDLRAAVRSGRVELVARGSFDGHHVDWLRVVPRRDVHWYALRQLAEVGVDARTYKPILVRSGNGHHFLYTRILSAQAMAYNAATFKAHGPRQRPPFHGKVEPGFDFGSTIPSASRRTVVGGPWLTAETTAAGLRLRAVRPFTIRRSKHHFGYGARSPKAMRGLELTYGPASALPARINLYGPRWEPRAGTRATTIYEVRQAPHVPPWAFVPRDSVEVQSGLATVGNRVDHTLTIGYLRERGLFITIRTPHGPRTVLQIARGLHTAHQ